MTAHRTAILPPNTSVDNARNRPASLPRRHRVASAIASALISGVLLGGVVFGMVDSKDAAAVTAGTASVASQA